MLADDAEVALVFLGAAQGVEGSGAHEAVNIVLLGALDLLDDALGLHVDDACQNGHAVVDDAHGLFQQLEALVVVEEGNLAARAQEEQAVDAAFDHAVDGALEGGHVELAVCVQGHNDRRDDAVELGICHEATSCFSR